MRLNLVFHNIVKNKKDVNNDFCVTKDYYFELTQKIKNLIRENKTNFKQICFYFDDGYLSFKDLIFLSIKDNWLSYYLAIVTDWINKDNFLSEKDLIFLRDSGVNICSHGISHSSLAIYADDKLQATPRGGEYINIFKGKKKVLTQNEVVYQLKESKRILERILGQPVNEFVLPYGLYNNQTLQINGNNGLYKTISTCEEFLDNGKNLKPRFLVMNTRAVDETLKLILKLKLK